MKLIAFYALFHRECQRFLRVLGQTIFTPLISSFLYLLIFGVSLSRSLHFFSLNYLEFLLPGLIMMAAISNSYLNSASSLVIAKHYGDIEDLKTSPLTPGTILHAMGLAATARALLISIMIFFTGEVFCAIFLGYMFLPKYLLLAVYILLMTGLTFGVLGTAAGAFAKSFETLHSINHFLLVPLIYLGGVFYPLNYLPLFWQNIARYNPMFYYMDSIRYAFFGFSESSPYFSFIVVTMTFLVSYLFSYLLIKKASFKRV